MTTNDAPYGEHGPVFSRLTGHWSDCPTYQTLDASDCDCYVRPDPGDFDGVAASPFDLDLPDEDDEPDYDDEPFYPYAYGDDDRYPPPGVPFFA